MADYKQAQQQVKELIDYLETALTHIEPCRTLTASLEENLPLNSINLPFLAECLYRSVDELHEFRHNLEEIWCYLEAMNMPVIYGPPSIFIDKLK